MAIAHASEQLTTGDILLGGREERKRVRCDSRESTPRPAGEPRQRRAIGVDDQRAALGPAMQRVAQHVEIGRPSPEAAEHGDHGAVAWASRNSAQARMAAASAECRSEKRRLGIAAAADDRAGARGAVTEKAGMRNHERAATPRTRRPSDASEAERGVGRPRRLSILEALMPLPPT